MTSRDAPWRAVGDIGSHWLDLAQFVTGRRVESLLADLHTALPTRLRRMKPALLAAGCAEIEQP